MIKSSQSPRLYTSPSHPFTLNSPVDRKPFFKTANPWGSSYRPLCSSQSDFLRKKPKSKISSLQSPYTPKLNETKVESAINYLILRDLGCTREDALTFTSRKQSDHRNFANNLPPKLRKDFKSNLNKNRYIPFKHQDKDENFEMISEAFKELMKKKQVYFDQKFLEQEKYVKSLEREGKKLKIFRKDEEVSPVVIISPAMKEMKRQVTKRVIVPELKHVETDINFMPIEKPKHNIKRPSHISMISDYHEVKSDESNGLLHVPMKSNAFHSNAGRSHKISLMSMIPDIKPNDAKSEIMQKDSSLLKSYQNFTDSQLNYTGITHTIKQNSINQSLDYEIRVHQNSESDEESGEVDFIKLINEEKKLIDMIRLQKYRNAQKKGEENHKILLKNQQRRKMLENKEAENKIKKYEIKKEKIRQALLKKQSILEEKAAKNKSASPVAITQKWVERHLCKIKS